MTTYTYQGLGWRNLPPPAALADNANLSQPHSIIIKYLLVADRNNCLALLLKTHSIQRGILAKNWNLYVYAGMDLLGGVGGCTPPWP